MTLGKCPVLGGHTAVLSGCAAPRPSPRHGAWQVVSRWPSVFFHGQALPGGAGWQIRVGCLCAPPTRTQSPVPGPNVIISPPHPLMAGGRGPSRLQGLSPGHRCRRLSPSPAPGGSHCEPRWGEGQRLDHRLEEDQDQGRMVLDHLPQNHLGKWRKYGFLPSIPPPNLVGQIWRLA